MYGSITEPSTGLGSMLKSQKGKVTKGSAIDEVLPTAAWGRTLLQNQELWRIRTNSVTTERSPGGLTRSDDGGDCVQK